jgi:hypothetical protein
VAQKPTKDRSSQPEFGVQASRAKTAAIEHAVCVIAYACYLAGSRNLIAKIRSDVCGPKIRTAEGLAPNVTFRLGSSFELDRALGSFRLVTMGRSFHWMDRAATLRTLDGMIDHGGAVALFRESHVDVQENEWYQKWRTITERHAKDDPARARRRDSSWLSHEQVLLSSPFSRLEAVSFIGRQLSTVDGLIERARSMSSLAPERIGERADRLEQDLRTLLADVLSRDGLVTEILEWTALIARRG